MCRKYERKEKKAHHKCVLKADVSTIFFPSSGFGMKSTPCCRASRLRSGGFMVLVAAKSLENRFTCGLMTALSLRLEFNRGEWRASVEERDFFDERQETRKAM